MHHQPGVMVPDSGFVGALYLLYLCTEYFVYSRSPVQPEKPASVVPSLRMPRGAGYTQVGIARVTK